MPAKTITKNLMLTYPITTHQQPKQMLAKSTHVLLEGVPEGVDPDALHDQLR